MWSTGWVLSLVHQQKLISKMLLVLLNICVSEGVLCCTFSLSPWKSNGSKCSYSLVLYLIPDLRIMSASSLIAKLDRPAFLWRFNAPTLNLGNIEYVVLAADCGEIIIISSYRVRPELVLMDSGGSVP